MAYTRVYPPNTPLLYIYTDVCMCELLGDYDTIASPDH